MRKLRLVLMPPMHDPILHALRPQTLTALLRLIRLIRVHRILVSHDQRVRYLRVRYVRWRELNPRISPDPASMPMCTL